MVQTPHLGLMVTDESGQDADAGVYFRLFRRMLAGDIPQSNMHILDGAIHQLAVQVSQLRALSSGGARYYIQVQGPGNGALQVVPDSVTPSGSQVRAGDTGIDGIAAGDYVLLVTLDPDGMAELLDIRNAAGGTVHPSAGDAVRAVEQAVADLQNGVNLNGTRGRQVISGYINDAVTLQPGIRYILEDVPAALSVTLDDTLAAPDISQEFTFVIPAQANPYAIGAEYFSGAEVTWPQGFAFDNGRVQIVTVADGIACVAGEGGGSAGAALTEIPDFTGIATVETPFALCLDKGALPTGTPLDAWSYEQVEGHDGPEDAWVQAFEPPVTLRALEQPGDLDIFPGDGDAAVRLTDGQAEAFFGVMKMAGYLFAQVQTGVYSQDVGDWVFRLFVYAPQAIPAQLVGIDVPAGWSEIDVESMALMPSGAAEIGLIRAGEAVLSGGDAQTAAGMDFLGLMFGAVEPFPAGLYARRLDGWLFVGPGAAEPGREGGDATGVYGSLAGQVSNTALQSVPPVAEKLELGNNILVGAGMSVPASGELSPDGEGVFLITFNASFYPQFSGGVQANFTVFLATDGYPWNEIPGSKMTLTAVPARYAQATISVIAQLVGGQSVAAYARTSDPSIASIATDWNGASLTMTRVG